MINGIDTNRYLSMIRQLESLTGKESSLQTKAMNAAKEEKASKTSSADMLLLSPSARQLSEFFKTEKSPDAENAETDLDGMKLKGEMLAESLQTQLNAFQGKMITLLQSAGFDADSPINLQSSLTGKIQVTNDRSDKAEIESLLQNAPGLAGEFRKISMLAAVVQANGVQAGGITPQSNDLLSGAGMNQGLRNPLTMISQYVRNSNSGSHSANSDRFNLRIANGQASYYFG